LGCTTAVPPKAAATPAKATSYVSTTSSFYGYFPGKGTATFYNSSATFQTNYSSYSTHPGSDS
jgi:hypothetical protein